MSSEVEDITAGARVAVDPSLFCGHCDYCRVQRGNLCRNWNAIGDTVDGAFAELVKAPARNAYELPEGTSARTGALVEPLAARCMAFAASSPIRALRAGHRREDDGSVCCSSCWIRAERPASLSSIATNVGSSSLARSLGATQVETEVQAALGDHPDGFDCVVDATGVPAVVQKGLEAARRGGKLMVFGIAPEEARVEVSPFRIYNDEITLVGSMAVLYTFVQAIELLRSGTIQTEPLLTHQVLPNS